MPTLPADDKASVRSRVLAALRAMPPELRHAKSIELRRAVAPHLASGGLHVCLYAPMAHEVDVLPLLDEYPHNAYYFPRCLPGRTLSFHRVERPAEQMRPEALGIRAPLPHLPQLPPEQAQLVLVPGVAFTRNGARLGYGGGYYDRFLPLCTRARTLALAFAEQLIPSLSTEPHDCTIDTVLWV